jgi:hypothetical protein
MNVTEGSTLVRLARESIETAFEGGRVVVPREQWLAEQRAAFVTLRLRRSGELRGCIGTLEAHKPLGEAVIDYARLAAFEDRRFEPLTRAELDIVLIDVSVLSAHVPLPVESEADAHAKLERTRPGVLLSYRGRRGVFLPQVWASLQDPREFLRHLKEKAGLPGQFWSDEIDLRTFACEEYAEPDPPPAPEAAS